MRARVATILLGLAAASVARADGELEDPEVARRVGPPPARADRAKARPAGALPPLVRAGIAGFDPGGPGSGALAGKTIYVSAGHGWYWNAAAAAWRTQRGNTHDLVEDFISAETVAQYLIPYLHDLGAYVVPVREADLSTELVIVDDGDAVVTGAATAAADGFATPTLPLTGAANPFAGGGSRIATAGAAAEPVATWTLPIAADGEANVYLAWVQAPDRAADAHYVIHHAGGASHVRVDQRRHGSTWVLVGQYRFRAGDPPERRRIELLGDSTAGGTLSIDAVRVGGGVGRVDRGGGASGRPAFEDAARYAAQWNGAPASVWDYAEADNNDDVGTRSRFSAWDHEPGEDAVYVAWHTNAPSPARGTSSFAYGPSAFGPLSEFTGVPGSLELMDAIHDELIADFRAVWDPSWQDRAQHTAYFGEVNPNHNPEMPATLIEVAFHDTEADAAALRDPRFRRLAARAFAHGIARYFARRDGAALTLPPEPPAAVRAVWQDGGLAIAWAPPAADPAGGDPATSYRVHLSRDGRGFDDGRAVDDTAVTIAAAELGDARFVRVVAVNAGGRSRPSPVVGADGRGATPDVLVVAGFTRLDGTMLFHEDLASRGLGTVDRAYIARINDESHGARAGRALADAGYGFAVATAEAVRAGAVDLAGFRAIVWLAGEQEAALGADDRAALAGYLDGGGALVVTGADVARELATDDPAFLARLGAGFAADDAATYELAGAGALAGASFRFDDSGAGGYDADAPDVLTAAGGAPLLTYPDGTVAAVAGPGAAVLGVPIETVATAEARAQILGAALAAAGVAAEPDDAAGETTAGCGCRASDRGAPGTAAAVVLLALGALLSRRFGRRRLPLTDGRPPSRMHLPWPRP